MLSIINKRKMAKLNLNIVAMVDMHLENENKGNLIPLKVMIALSCIYDDMALMTAFYLELYIKYVDISHNVFYF